MGQKTLWKTKIINAVSAFCALEVKKSLLTIKPQDFGKKGSLPEDYSLELVARKCRQKTELLPLQLYRFC